MQLLQFGRPSTRGLRLFLWLAAAMVCQIKAANPFSSNVVALTPKNWREEVLDSPHGVFINICRVGWGYCQLLTPGEFNLISFDFISWEYAVEVLVLNEWRTGCLCEKCFQLLWDAMMVSLRGTVADTLRSWLPDTVLLTMLFPFLFSATTQHCSFLILHLLR